jgi:DNA-binding CsgD family transcriptional regulator
MGNVVIATVVDITKRRRTEEQEKLLERAGAKIELCQQLGVAAAVLEPDERVRLMNPLFEEVHAQFMSMRDRLEVKNPVANKALRQELAQLSRGINDRIIGPIPVRTEDRHLPLAAYLLPMRASFGMTLGIMIVITPNKKGAPSTSLLQSLFALTPAEARVAALVGSGLSPREAAKELSISEGNLRTTLKHVFAKVGISRQSELAILLSKFSFR